MEGCNVWWSARIKFGSRFLFLTWKHLCSSVLKFADDTKLFNRVDSNGDHGMTDLLQLDLQTNKQTNKQQYLIVCTSLVPNNKRDACTQTAAAIADTYLLDDDGRRSSSFNCPICCRHRDGSWTSQQYQLRRHVLAAWFNSVTTLLLKKFFRAPRRDR